MKKTVLTFGLIAGAILSAMMLITIPFQDEIALDHSLIIGYTTMVVAFLFIYFGVRSYRDNVAGGTVRFGRALAVGASIGLVASLCYVAMWQVVYFNFMPDFLTKYQAQMIQEARAKGESEVVISKMAAEFEQMATQYNNPLFNAAYTILEPLPVALLISLVSAGVLSRKRRPDGAGGLVDGGRSSAST
jgi:hypothetical protein